ncbi:hypothetical protein DPMN_140579 [Dreissena polymorpha]|uniref:Uncharacterized protein n=1 Tax=Dreissena polymorpha TaxID=45954 RepID=A0A9D4G7V7_DREPO|nr:hypothetical protein DPMN_140579 [Dreissena polymorpha]
MRFSKYEAIGCGHTWKWIGSTMRNYHATEDTYSHSIFSGSVYTPVTDYTKKDKENFYEHLQYVVDQIPKKDILVVRGN